MVVISFIRTYLVTTWHIVIEFTLTLESKEAIYKQSALQPCKSSLLTRMIMLINQTPHQYPLAHA